MTSPSRGDRAALVGIALAFLSSVALVWPAGEFPLNDDWAYARTARILGETGSYAPSGWDAMTLVAQAAWGALFVKVFGFSFTALRASTLVLALVALAATYGAARLTRTDVPTALLATAAVLVNPMFTNLASTFMTDVPFLALAMTGLCFLGRFLDDRAWPALVLGTFFCVAATLTRQLGLFVPVAFVVVRLLRDRQPRAFVEAFVPLAWAVTALVTFERWLSGRGLPEAYAVNTADLQAALASGFPAVAARSADRLLVIAFYLGLLLAPLVLPAAVVRVRALEGRPRRHMLAVAAAAALVLGIRLVTWHGLVPLQPNVLWNLGIGPPTLSDVGVLELANATTAPIGFWRLVWAVGYLGAIGLAVNLASVGQMCLRGTARGNGPLALLALSTGVYLLPLLPGEIFFDRYLLAPLTTVAIISVFRLSMHRGAAAAAIVGFALLMGFSVAGKRDYFAWNRARSAALTHVLRDLRVPPTRLDGGFEFNGWTLYEPGFEPLPGRAWWWVHDDEWRIAFGPVPGYLPESRWPYPRLLPPGEGNVFVLRRLPEGSGRLSRSSIGKDPR